MIRYPLRNRFSQLGFSSWRYHYTPSLSTGTDLGMQTPPFPPCMRSDRALASSKHSTSKWYRLSRWHQNRCHHLLGLQTHFIYPTWRRPSDHSCWLHQLLVPLIVRVTWHSYSLWRLRQPILIYIRRERGRERYSPPAVCRTQKLIALKALPLFILIAVSQVSIVLVLHVRKLRFGRRIQWEWAFSSDKPGSE